MINGLCCPDVASNGEAEEEEEEEKGRKSRPAGAVSAGVARID